MYGTFARLIGMQAVPALRVHRLTAQFVVAGDAPHVGLDLELLRKESPAREEPR